MRKTRYVVLALASAVASLVMAAGASGASAKPGVPRLEFTTVERQTLQAQVDQHLHDYGSGTQMGLNEIMFDDGRVVLTLPLPGERKARAMDEPVSAQGVANCASLFACLWSDTNFNGTRLSKIDCGQLTLAAPFTTSTASIHNNQSSGTQTIIYNGSHSILNASMAPSRINDTGVGTRANARFWLVCP